MVAFKQTNLVTHMKMVMHMDLLAKVVEEVVDTTNQVTKVVEVEVE